MPDQTVWRKSSYSGGRENCVEVSLATWHKSSHSGVNNNCVEVAALASAAAVRDSKRPGGAALAFPAAEWRAFVAGLHREEFAG